LLGGLDATKAEFASVLIEQGNPDVSLNSRGIVKQRAAAKDAQPQFKCNISGPRPGGRM
jgi:hypothetical protein